MARRNDHHFLIRMASKTLRQIKITLTGKFRILADWKTLHRVEQIAASSEAVFIAGDHKISLLSTKDGSTRFSQALADTVVAIAVDSHYATVVTSRGDLLFLSMTEALPTLRRFKRDQPISSPIALDATRIAYLVDGYCYPTLKFFLRRHGPFVLTPRRWMPFVTRTGPGRTPD